MTRLYYFAQFLREELREELHSWESWPWVSHRVAGKLSAGHAVISELGWAGQYASRFIHVVV